MEKHRNSKFLAIIMVALLVLTVVLIAGCSGGGGGGSSSGGDTSSSSSSSGSSSGSSSSSSSSGSSSGSSSSSSSSGSSSSSSSSGSSSSSSSSSSGGGTVSYSFEWRKNTTNPDELYYNNGFISVSLVGSIARFNTDGNPQTTITDPEFNTTRALTYDQNGNNYVANTNSNYKVFRFNVNWSEKSLFATATYEPRSMAAKYGNKVVILETRNGFDAFVEVFDSNGTQIGFWEITGANTAMGIALTPSGQSVTIADTNNHRILKYSISGTYQGTFGSYGTGSGEYELCYPKAIDVDTDENIYVLDGDVNSRFTVYNSVFLYLGRFLGTPGSGDGQFYSPHGITVDPNGNVYVTNMLGENLQKFKKNP